jgi:hypothetical protein
MESGEGFGLEGLKGRLLQLEGGKAKGSSKDNRAKKNKTPTQTIKFLSVAEMNEFLVP